MHEVELKTINVKTDQHEEFINLKRGRDTNYDVMDRLLAQNRRLGDLEKTADGLHMRLEDLSVAVRELTEVMYTFEVVEERKRRSC